MIANVPPVIDVDHHTFATEVLDRSTQVPVVVDFWAPWCGPCRVLGPVLERLAREAAGAWVLAKLNVDHNGQLAQQFGVGGIPDVKAFRDRKVVAQFTGALPETRVRRWLKQILPSEADQLADAATQKAAAQPAAAIALYRRALELDPEHEHSLWGLGRMLTLSGDPQATEILGRIKVGSPFYVRAQALRDLLPLFATNDEGAPTAIEAYWQAAAEHARQGQWDAALDQLLMIVQRNRAWREDAARRAMLAIFALLGDGDTRVTRYRQRLASALF